MRTSGALARKETKRSSTRREAPLREAPLSPRLDDPPPGYPSAQRSRLGAEKVEVVVGRPRFDMFVLGEVGFWFGCFCG